MGIEYTWMQAEKMCPYLSKVARLQREALEEVFFKCLVRDLTAIQTMAHTNIIFRTKMTDMRISPLGPR